MRIAKLPMAGMSSFLLVPTAARRLPRGGSNLDDIFSGNAFNATLFRSGIYLLQVYNFRQVNANLSSTSGADIAELIDGVGIDFLTATGSAAQITYSAGKTVRLSAFDSVIANNQSGGTVVEPLTFQLFFIGTRA